MGLLPPVARVDSGNILFRENESLLHPSTSAAIRGSQIGMIFQEPMSSLNPVLTIENQLSEVLPASFLKKEKREACLQWLEKVQIENPAATLRKYPHQLSGGQRQRVMIAMALMPAPKILIADEPTTALDSLTQKEILQLVEGLQKEMGLSVLFITHDLDLVEHTAQQVVVMEKGKVVENNTVNEIFKHPKAPYTRRLLASTQLKPVAAVAAGKEAILSIQNLHLGYHKPSWWSFRPQTTAVLKGISFEVYKGETLGIVGGSGSGKTTLGKAILQLLDSSEGKIFFEGKPFPEDHAGPFKKKIQVVFQDPFTSLNPKQSIRNCLSEVLAFYQPKLSKQAIDVKTGELMEMVGLERDQLDRLPKQFSGGQRQRICIARALAANPEVLILDEAVSSLDVTVQKMILDLLQKLKSDLNLTYLFISHDLHVVQYLADRILVLLEGEIDAIGPTGEIITNPPTPYSQKLLAAVPANWKRN